MDFGMTESIDSKKTERPNTLNKLFKDRYKFSKIFLLKVSLLGTTYQCSTDVEM